MSIGRTAPAARSSRVLTLRSLRIEQEYIQALSKLHDRAKGADILQDEYVCVARDTVGWRG